MKYATNITPDIKDVKTADHARQLAIDWQAEFADQPTSYQALADASDYFTKLGKKFNLTDEYRENGII